MNSYQIFARVYDEFMENVPYDRWCGQIRSILTDHGISDGLVLDLGCGTGQMTRRLSKAGYDMIGVDRSVEMLEAAFAKEAEREEQLGSILYLNQDMRSFELYGTVRAVVSVCDSMNYLIHSNDFLQTLRLVNNYLDPGGLFLFDLNTIHKYRDEIGNTTIAENNERASFIWENTYEEEHRINEYLVTFFIEEQDGLYRKYEELHTQRGYEISEVRSLIRQAGMKLLDVFDSETLQPGTEGSARLLFVAQESGKAQATEHK